MEKLFRYTGISILLLALTACSPVDSLKPFDQEQAARLLQQNMQAKPTQEMISVTLPKHQDWQRIDLSYMNKGAPIMLIPKDESDRNWHESVRTKIRAYANYPDATAYQFAQAEIKAAKENCLKADATLLAQNKNYSLYQINMIDCGQEKNQIQIGKIFNGSDAVYAVRYTALQGYISPEQIKLMASVISNASLIKNARVRS